MAHHIFHRGILDGAAVVAQGSPDITGQTRIEWTVEDMGTTYADNDPVGSWADLGGLYTMTAAGAARPEYQTDATLGVGIHFDATDDEMTTATGLALDVSGGLTVFLVHQRDSTTLGGLHGPFCMRESGKALTANILGTYWDGATTLRHDHNRNVSADQWTHANAEVAITTPMITSARYDATLDPADNPVYFQGNPPASPVAEAGASNAPATAVDSMMFGHGYSPFFKGTLYCCVVYYGALMTQDQVDSVYSSLNTRFSVY